MKKPIKITETDLNKIIQKVMKETPLKEDGHMDIPSAIRKCQLILDDAEDILERLAELQQHGGHLPTWWMDKLTLAADYLDTADDYINTSGHLQEQVEIYGEEEMLTSKNDFTSMDRKMLHAIYDVIVKGGSGGGYKGGRKRSLAPIGALPTNEQTQKSKK